MNGVLGSLLNGKRGRGWVRLLWFCERLRFWEVGLVVEAGGGEWCRY